MTSSMCHHLSRTARPVQPQSAFRVWPRCARLSRFRLKGSVRPRARLGTAGRPRTADNVPAAHCLPPPIPAAPGCAHTTPPRRRIMSIMSILSAPSGGTACAPRLRVLASWREKNAPRRKTL